MPFAKTILGLCLLLLGLAVAQPAQAQPKPDFCTGKRSCFMALDGRDRGFCQAYVEGKSCFMAFNNTVDRGWCQNVREGKSCFMALDGQARSDCNAGRVPREHRYWMYVCGRW